MYQPKERLPVKVKPRCLKERFAGRVEPGMGTEKAGRPMFVNGEKFNLG